ncbi:ankyrin repeat domain-containing protein [Candidatus Babeliales bacterium]|nr:ankyrin repeat domain-containing protein [Candidatus Babeliales bacterium]
MGYARPAITFFILGFSFMVRSNEAHKAIRTGDIKSLEQWLSSGDRSLQINEQDERGDTPFAIAVSNRDLRAVTLLLYYGADPQLTTTASVLLLSCLAAYGLNRSMDRPASSEKTAKETAIPEMYRTAFKGLIFAWITSLLVEIPQLFRSSATSKSLFLLAASGFSFPSIYYTAKTFYHLGKDFLQKSNASSESSATSDTAIV